MPYKLDQAVTVGSVVKLTGRGFDHTGKVTLHSKKSLLIVGPYVVFLKEDDGPYTFNHGSKRKKYVSIELLS